MKQPQIPKAPWPKLSEALPHERKPGLCQSCGREAQRRWIEHDENDKPTTTILFLCQPCEKRLIEKHPRLYASVVPNKPIPGTLAICLNCTQRKGLECQSPFLVANGGAGLKIYIDEPSWGFVSRCGPGGRREGGLLEVWSTPAKACDGRKV